MQQTALIKMQSRRPSAESWREHYIKINGN